METRQLPRIVALAGFMAVGKSTVGRSLASRLKWRLIDLDCEIETRTGQTIRDIFEKHGEARFREVETDALLAILERATGDMVIALGGGTFIQPQNADLLLRSGVRVVFLELEVEELFQRCREGGERLAENPRPLAKSEEEFWALYAQRLPFYRRAELAVNMASKAPDQIAQEIAEAL